MNRIQQQLLELKDDSYKEFHAKLIPTVEKAKIIGVRTPVLRKYAKELLKQAKTDEKVKEEVAQFMEQLPYMYYEENNLHGLLIEGIKEYEECVQKLDRFLPYVDNWATCDLLSMKLFKKYPQPVLEKVKQWMASKHIYTVRFGIGTLMRYYLEEQFKPEYLQWVAAVDSEEYYVKMMVAWYFATALAKQYEVTLPYLEKGLLPTWNHNKTIQKAVESYRITPEQKQYLRTLKRK